MLNAPSRVLDLGSTVRLVPPWMRKAVLATYDTCAYDTCPIPATWCEMDHVHPWAIHHSTKLDDIAPACDHHNRDRAKNPHSYRAQRRSDGRWHITSVTQRYRS
ncbi:HNH endonuclease signature motif containing protein [Actinopolymorpha sp. B17G11]|uniref:HNH endonuclease signature motif containing protein n=1 Tax=Actinopolymorpha sp. B17G11 TaxID=3160861 RepID=UPI0032E4F6C6